MNTTPPATARRGRPALVAAALLLAAGCGDSSGVGKRYPVSGAVTYNGSPVETGSIMFQPMDQEAGRAASGVIKDGEYELTTVTEGDGALPGEYRVAITSKDVDMSKAEANASGGGSMRQDDVMQAYADAKDLVPSKYSLADTSGLTYTVKEGSNRGVNFDLK